MDNEVDTSSSNTYTQSESTWIFMPSFLSCAVDFRYLNTCGYIERTIRTYPVISRRHPRWEMCFDGDVKGIQKLIGDRQISPFSIDIYGNTLLQVRSDI
jgi:hypothetical protein